MVIENLHFHGEEPVRSEPPEGTAKNSSHPPQNYGGGIPAVLSVAEHRTGVARASNAEAGLIQKALHELRLGRPR